MMGEFRCWITKKDNPQMTEAEVASFNRMLSPFNSGSNNKINSDYYLDNPPKASWEKDKL